MARRLAQLMAIGAAVTATTLAVGSTASAGGPITIMDAFAPPSVGEPLDVTFGILRHGVTPMDVEGVVLVVTEPDGERLEFPAERAGDVGRYRATLELDEPGQHRWSVVQGEYGRQDLGRLDVAAADPASAGGWTMVWPAATVAGIVAVVGGGAAFVALSLHRRRLRRAALP